MDAVRPKSALPTGVEYYTEALLPRLSTILINKGISVYWIGHRVQAPASMPRGVQWIYSAHTLLWAERRLPRILKKLQPDLYFTPSRFPPLSYAGRTAFVVHDMSVYLYPAAYSWFNRWRLTGLSRGAALKAASLIAVSNYTGEMIHRFWPESKAKVMVVPSGYAPSFSEPQAVKLASEDPVILYVGRIEEKKNLKSLIQAFAQVLAEMPVQLVLAGKDGIGHQEVYQEIAMLPDLARPKIICTGYISEGQKEWLWKRASVAAAPCPIEGFGFPLLEAFAHHVPAVAAQGGGLLEVGGEACLFAQSDSATDWYLQIKKLLSEPNTRETMVQRGENRYKEYTWETTAAGIAAALISAIPDYEESNTHSAVKTE